jgi:hypothetical protein
VVTDEIMQRTFKNTFVLNVIAAAQPQSTTTSKKAQPPGSKPGPTPDGQGGIALPTVIKLKQSDERWAQHFAAADDCLDVVDDPVEVNGKMQASYTFYLNESNVSLQTELKGKKVNAGVVSKQFEIGAVLLGLGLIHEQRGRTKTETDDEDDKDGEAGLRRRVQVVSRAVAPVLLPMIQTLGELGEDDIDVSDLAGEAVATEAVETAS